MSRWHGDEWRWRPERHRFASSRSISVIEPPKTDDDEEPTGRVHRVPFGFSVREPAPEVEPLVWEGDGA